MKQELALFIGLKHGNKFFIFYSNFKKLKKEQIIQLKECTRVRNAENSKTSRISLSYTGTVKSEYD